MTITYRARRTRNGAGNWNVYVERIDSDRPDPDPWGNGPIIEQDVARNIRPGRAVPGGWQTVPGDFGHGARPPAGTDEPFAEAQRIADELNG